MMKVQKRTPFEFRADGPMVFFGPYDSIATICHCQVGGGGSYDNETGKWWNHFVSKQEAEANAEFIALAVNAHDDLVAALKSAKEAIRTMYSNADWSNGNTHPDYLGGDDEGEYLMMNFVNHELGIIDAALAKAEGAK